MSQERTERVPVAVATSRCTSSPRLPRTPHRGRSAQHLLERRWPGCRWPARLSGRVTLLAPDMRGRAESAPLRSTGLADHVADVVRVLDHYGLESPVLAGHAMGGFAAALTAATHPDRVGSVVLLDGGLAFPSPGTFDVDEVLHSIIGPGDGPSVDDLRRRRPPTCATGLAHPAMGPLLDSPAGGDLTAYLLHDLAGPRRADAVHELAGVRAGRLGRPDERPATLSAIHTLQCRAHLLWAARGPLGQPQGLYSPERIAEARLPGDIESPSSTATTTASCSSRPPSVPSPTLSRPSPAYQHPDRSIHSSVK